jgi:pyruvate-ferredoxin/flavodoxin oxidoreductase
MLARTHPEAARELLHAAQEDVDRQWRVYSNRAAIAGHTPTTSVKEEKHADFPAAGSLDAGGDE